MFFEGIVENNNDPEKLGRVQVRVFGLHTDNRTDNSKNSYLPVEDLPWAELAFPPMNASISQIGSFGVPECGSRVWLFFKDEERQYPVVFGSIFKLESTQTSTDGFTDPNGIYPSLNGESGVSRLARNENIAQTIVASKNSNRKTSIDCANGISFDQPVSPYNATYPENKVIQTKSHVLELDDSNGNERVHIYHKSGSFEEISPDGTRVERTQSKRYTIILNDDNILIEGNHNIHVNGNVNLKCDNTVNITATSKVNINGGNGNMKGVVTGDCVCAFTNKPHFHYSSDVIASN